MPQSPESSDGRTRHCEPSAKGSFLGYMAATEVALEALDKPPYNPFSEAVLELVLKL